MLENKTYRSSYTLILDTNQVSRATKLIPLIRSEGLFLSFEIFPCRGTSIDIVEIATIRIITISIEVSILLSVTYRTDNKSVNIKSCYLLDFFTLNQ